MASGKSAVTISGALAANIQRLEDIFGSHTPKPYESQEDLVLALNGRSVDKVIDMFLDNPSGWKQTLLRKQEKSQQLAAQKPKAEPKAKVEQKPKAAAAAVPKPSAVNDDEEGFIAVVHHKVKQPKPRFTKQTPRDENGARAERPAATPRPAAASSAPAPSIPKPKAAVQNLPVQQDVRIELASTWTAGKSFLAAAKPVTAPVAPAPAVKSSAPSSSSSAPIPSSSPSAEVSKLADTFSSASVSENAWAQAVVEPEAPKVSVAAVSAPVVSPSAPVVAKAPEVVAAPVMPEVVAAPVVSAPVIPEAASAKQAAPASAIDASLVFSDSSAASLSGLTFGSFGGNKRNDPYAAFMQQAPAPIAAPVAAPVAAQQQQAVAPEQVAAQTPEQLQSAYAAMAPQFNMMSYAPYFMGGMPYGSPYGGGAEPQMDPQIAAYMAQFAQYTQASSQGYPFDYSSMYGVSAAQSQPQVPQMDSRYAASPSSRVPGAQASKPVSVQDKPKTAAASQPASHYQQQQQQGMPYQAQAAPYMPYTPYGMAPYMYSPYVPTYGAPQQEQQQQQQQAPQQSAPQTSWNPAAQPFSSQSSQSMPRSTWRQ